MPQANQTAKIREDVSEEDLLRANLYGLLALLLASAPSQDAIRNCAVIHGDGSDLGEGTNALAKLASARNTIGIKREYSALLLNWVGASCFPMPATI